ncbi:membrane protein insertion efficiency factor YidD [bacterium]|nr:membrane protein insertion efficiency factor YidD [bacterium]
MFTTKKITADDARGCSGIEVPDFFFYRHPENRPRVTVRLALSLIRSYQLIISPIIRPACRYVPSCSDYTLQVIRRFGIWQGCYLGLYRILRCHPFARGGYDPPPAKLPRKVIG